MTGDGGDVAIAVSERAVLGAALQSDRDAGLAAGLLAAEDFTSPSRRAVFGAVAALADGGYPVDIFSVIAELGDRLDGCGDPDAGCRGGDYLWWLTGAAGDVAYHAGKVRAAAQQRDAVRALTAARDLAAAPGWDPDVTPDRIRALADTATGTTVAAPLRTAADLVDDAIGTLGDGVDPGLPTGLADLDEVTGGLRPGELTVLAGRPGAGKSAVALTIAEHAATDLGLPVLYSSLEMTAEMLTHRRIAAAAGVPLLRLTRHQATEDDQHRIAAVRDMLASSALLIDPARGVAAGHVRGRLRGLARAGTPARLCVVDYVGLMAAPAAESRRVAVSEVTRAVRDLAGEHGLPVLLLAQLRRGGASRADRRPHLEDLKETGELEEAADVVLLLHRDDYYDRESPRAGELDVIVGKNRQGPLCTVTLAFQGHYGRVADLGPEPWTPHAAAWSGNGDGRVFVHGRDD